MKFAFAAIAMVASVASAAPTSSSPLPAAQPCVIPTTTVTSTATPTPTDELKCASKMPLVTDRIPVGLEGVMVSNVPYTVKPGLYQCEGKAKNMVCSIYVFAYVCAHSYRRSHIHTYSRIYWISVTRVHAWNASTRPHTHTQCMHTHTHTHARTETHAYVQRVNALCTCTHIRTH